MSAVITPKVGDRLGRWACRFCRALNWPEHTGWCRSCGREQDGFGA